MKNTKEFDFSDLIEKCKKYLICDTARISKPLENGKMFLIVGFDRNTKNDEGKWINRNYETVNFNYTQESVVASGFDEKELIDSVKEYTRLSQLNWNEYFEELRGKK
jgi:hypothetical protein